MTDLRMARVGVVDDTYGEPVEISVQWDEEADPETDEGACVVISGGGDIVLDQEGAEQFARLFVSACWAAARGEPS